MGETREGKRTGRENGRGNRGRMIKGGKEGGMETEGREEQDGEDERGGGGLNGERKGKNEWEGEWI